MRLRRPRINEDVKLAVTAMLVMAMLSAIVATAVALQ
jgi:hypothetical protein